MPWRELDYLTVETEMKAENRGDYQLEIHPKGAIVEIITVDADLVGENHAVVIFKD